MTLGSSNGAGRAARCKCSHTLGGRCWGSPSTEGKIFGVAGKGRVSGEGGLARGGQKKEGISKKDPREKKNRTTRRGRGGEAIEPRGGGRVGLSFKSPRTYDKR